jgi:phosphoserine phosphatase RsbU/P
MLSPDRFPALLRDLSRIDQPPYRSNPRRCGELILEAFRHHTDATAGLIYLCTDQESALELAATSGGLTAPAQLHGFEARELTIVSDDGWPAVISLLEIFPAPETILPIVRGGKSLGLVALAANGRVVGADPTERELISAASDYAASILRTHRMETEVREGDLQLRYRLLELESLYDIGLSIASTLNMEELAEEILVRTVSLLDARNAALFLRRGDRFLLHRSLGDVRPQFFDDELDSETVGLLVDQQKPIHFDRGADCIFPGCESFVALPIVGAGGTIGVLAAADREQRDGGIGAFTEGDVRLLSQFANQAAIALENARLHREALDKQAMERELELAATIQQDILPRSLPQVEGLELSTLSKPARQLGGDYHTFFEREGVLSICLGDVSGKSVPAAILVSALHAALQLLFHEGRDLGEIAAELNRHLHLWSAENKFVTLFLATVDQESEVIRYVNAGHNPPFMIHDGEVTPLHSHGLPVGLLPGSRYVVQTARFAPGSLLAVYSDGLSEAENAADDEFGEERLERLLVEKASLPCDVIVSEIAAAVDEFAGDLPQKDDQTMILVRHLA